MKGIRELQVTGSVGKGSLRAYEIRLDQMVGSHWIDADSDLSDDENEGEDSDLSEGDFFASLKNVSRRTKPSRSAREARET